MEIIVDDREKAIIPFMAEISLKYNINYKVQRNQIGDYAIIYRDNILLIIERKTWLDLAASMRDGRKENVKKLLNLREQTGCNIAYLIEGDANPAFTKKYGRLPVKNLRAHLDHLMFRDNIHIIYSKNELYTAERLFELGQNYLSNKELMKRLGMEQTKPIENKSGGFDIIIKRSNDKDDKDDKEFSNYTFLFNALNAADDIYNNSEELSNKSDGILCEPNIQTEKKEPNIQTEKKEPNIQTEYINDKIKGKDLLKVKQNIDLAIDQQILQCLACVGSCTAPLLSENNISLYTIYHKIHDCAYIANIKYSSGASIGLSKAKKITDCVSRINDNRYAKTRSRILSSIPLISKKTAETILKQIKLSDILDQTADISELANIKKTEKIKLGNAAATNIIKYLIPKSLEQHNDNINY